MPAVTDQRSELPPPERLPRLTAEQLQERFAKKTGEVTLSLSQILFEEKVVAGLEPGSTVVVKPINFKGLAGLEAEFGDLTKVPSQVEMVNSPRQLLRVLRILVNQDLPIDQERTEDEIGRIINATNIAVLAEAMASAMRPTPASGVGPEASPTGRG